ncbi:DUF222 domain-containing protein [Phycicoccus sp. BSK3Z-2]|uniref:DUF222 domain-containing protein n=1 Tax=Phycicoccus avicenniae TaxID=2828860 RepID=A0A941I092_9MICO|nr:HNH endonuclease signature motif containing protein [Phycicoccus avicenniae]MBR7743031.1 DUF222 domain-containing protein [Phycicoccus avicenniae]
MGLVDDVTAKGSAARVAVTVEAVRRGEVAGSGTHAWVREHAPSLREGGAASVTRVAVDVGSAGSGLTGTVDDASPLGLAWHAVESGKVEAGTACAVLREAARLEPHLRDDALPTVTAGLLGLAAEWGPSMMRRLRPRLLAEHGRAGVLDDLQDRLASSARLSMPRVESGDLTEYQLWMTPEQAATLEAVIGPLSAPAPDDETGERDLRPAGQRRVEALTEVCRTAAALDQGERGESATLHVTMPLADLRAGTGAGEVLATVADGTLLAPDAVRVLACDAALLPHVPGTDGEPLAVGRRARLFARAQRRHLLLRDRGCTYPGCTAPSAWTKAHHVGHCADGGATHIGNAALLCQRHHTTVHRRRLWAEVRGRPDERGRFVVWDLLDGSYDRALAVDAAPRAA